MHRGSVLRVHCNTSYHLLTHSIAVTIVAHTKITTIPTTTPSVIDVEILLWIIEHANSHSKTLMQRFARHGLHQAQSSKEEFQDQNFSMPNIFHDTLSYFCIL